jgi:hypothetical protein
VIDTTIGAATKHKLNTRETAHVLAIAYIESGFNPDAASNESASGVGQFVDKTGSKYGIDDSNRFDISGNTDALVRHYLDNKKTASERGNTGRQREERIYQYHHDGPRKEDRDSGEGLALSRTRVLPIADNIEKVLNGTFKGEHIDLERVVKKRHSHVHMALSIPKPRTNKKCVDPSAGNRLHPHAAETSAPHQQDYYNTKRWNIASRLYHLFHHDYDPDDGWTD